MSFFLEIDGRRVEVLSLHEVAKEITGSGDSPEYRARWKHLCDFYAERPDRTACKSATGPDPITIGEAQVYCEEHRLAIPDGLKTRRVQPELMEYRERIAREKQEAREAERALEALLAAQQGIEGERQGTSEPQAKERTRGGDTEETSYLKALWIELGLSGRTHKRNAGILYNEIIRRKEAGEDCAPFTEHDERGLGYHNAYGRPGFINLDQMADRVRKTLSELGTGNTRKHREARHIKG